MVEQAKFEYSLLGKIFNKWLEEDDERLTFKEFTIFEDKNEEQLKTIKDLGEKQVKATKCQEEEKLRTFNRSYFTTKTY